MKLIRSRGFCPYTGDAHLYSNHMEQMKEQLTRSVRPAPTLQLNPETVDF